MRPVAVGVTVPARNEQASIEMCLDALEAAVRPLRKGGITPYVVVVDDGGTDLTALLARRHLGTGRGEVLRVDLRNVGAARRAGMTRLLRHFGGVPTSRLWLASTDADTVVPPGWLLRQVGHAARGWDAVAGVVRVDDWSAHHPAARALFERRYARRVGRRDHGHVHAANLGVRASTYVAAGGFCARRCGEEHDLWARLDRPGVRRLADPGLDVTTSGRQRGRVRGGFSGDLATLNGRLAG
jgi:glycosyltransferase involved in cell wall biosynthesis